MAKDCKNYEENLKRCNCTYEPCSKKGYCCECIRYHLSLGEAPACLFPDDAEKTFDRSLEYLAKILSER
ncbi:MAG: hypothetical protein B6D57_03345 [Candidatus Coatesbacteria bacterium 4484_99]|uniref:Cytosolic protein n=1 Tax=Candidatus Coatesbacteria bacterium 4484_99 TaxID=1970774 RepID=A0A1W9S0M9_9BACT|nr:MAG: hypothetical protein B6D57_03345 [Candidatus Coatesbacteria bacterium 4484_99]RLC40896.1 MAG: hypothetical protein DRH51_04440 [Candidatus Coatesbacteria bacterium]RLC42626.1 MAG: hypothetical protein DRH44_06160 [Candidatus Coatesbacteria bacterium]RLC43305.1 MAG: hypothetical protein DRH49_01695 [Candidatus Coatesbacteria bacterium]